MLRFDQTRHGVLEAEGELLAVLAVLVDEFWDQFLLAEVDQRSIDVLAGDDVRHQRLSHRAQNVVVLGGR